VDRALAAWRTSGGLGVPRMPKLLPALAAVLTALAGAFERGASGPKPSRGLRRSSS
jgi:hypothetical protein